jgi:Flp pilus assembly protein TadD
MGCKEVMVTAPIAVYLFDAVFLSTTWRGPLRKRPILYGGLAATWIPLALLIASGPRSESAGLSLRDITIAQYLRTQPEVILHYLRLALIPYPLCIDYEWPIVNSWAAIVIPATILLCVLGIGIRGVLRRRPWSYGILLFFLILSVTSSFVPIVIVASEHRMYLPLACLCVLGVLCMDRAIARLPQALSASRLTRPVLLASVAVTLGILTVARNEEYRSGLSMWTDVVHKRPANARARNNLGTAFQERGELAEAIDQFRGALKLNPHYAEARYNLGSALGQKGLTDDAIVELREAARLRPNDARTENNLGYALQSRGKLDEAIVHYRAALAVKPRHVRALANLGVALALTGQARQAAPILEQAVALESDSVVAMNTLAWIRATHGDPAMRDGGEAVRLAEKASDLLQGRDAGALDTLAAANAESGDFDRALEFVQKALTVAEAEKRASLAQEIHVRLELYRAHKPYREDRTASQPTRRE